MTFLVEDPRDAFVTVLLAHGAGAPMDYAAMTAVSKALAVVGFSVVRFEFDYMALRRQGARRPRPKAELLQDEFRAAIGELKRAGPLISAHRRREVDGWRL